MSNDNQNKCKLSDAEHIIVTDDCSGNDPTYFSAKEAFIYFFNGELGSGYIGDLDDGSDETAKLVGCVGLMAIIKLLKDNGLLDKLPLTKRR